MPRIILLSTIGIAYTFGSLLTHNLLWNAMMSSGTFPKDDGKKSPVEYGKEIYGWFLSLHLLSLIWPITVVFGVLGMILGIIKSITSTK